MAFKRYSVSPRFRVKSVQPKPTAKTYTRILHNLAAMKWPNSWTKIRALMTAMPKDYYDSAISDFKEAIRLYPNDADAYKKEGIGLRQWGLLEICFKKFDIQL